MLVRLCDCGREVASGVIGTIPPKAMLDNAHHGFNPGLSILILCESATTVRSNEYVHNAAAVAQCGRIECDVCIAASAVR